MIKRALDSFKGYLVFAMHLVKVKDTCFCTIFYITERAFFEKQLLGII